MKNAIIGLGILVSGAWVIGSTAPLLFSGPATQLDYKSDVAILVRYVAKQEIMKDNPQWNANPYVQQVKTGGQLDMAKVRALFVERGIMDGPRFDAALASTSSYMTGVRANATAIDAYIQMKADRDAAVAEEDRIAKQNRGKI